MKKKQGTGYWQIPNAYAKKVRQMSMNQVRLECLRLAAALMDQRNANYVLMERINELTEPKQEAAAANDEATQPEMSTEGQKND